MIKAEMRKTKKRIDSQAELWGVLADAQVLYLAMSQGDEPYVVPMSFGLLDGAVFLHSGPKGLKMDILRANPKVCFSATTDYSVLTAEEACKWSLKFCSVVGFGRADEVTDEAAKAQALEAIMKHYSGRDDWEFNDQGLAMASVWRIEVESLSGKRSPAAS